MALKLTARRLLVGSDRLHQMAEDIDRLWRILSGALSKHALLHPESANDFLIPAFKNGERKGELHFSPKSRRQITGFWLVITTDSGSFIYQRPSSLEPADLVAFHRNLDAVLNAVLDHVPEIGPKLHSIADQAPPPIE